MLIQYDIVYPARKIDSVTKMGKNVWWMSPNDTRTEIDEHAPKGSYDSILALAPLTNHATGEHVPTGGWGLAIPPTDWSSGASYCTVGNAPVDLWNEPDVGEVWLHEWLHGACAHFAKKGWAMPKGDAHAGGSHGYKHSSFYGWGEFYRDLMTGQVLDEGRRTGITKDAWESGPICGKKLLVAADYFSSDTKPSYQTTGTVAWTGRGGKHENIALGGAQAGKSNLRLPVQSKNSFVITARVQIPALGMDDSVGIVVGDSYASLNYGTKLAGKTKMSIQFEQGQETSSEVTLAPGWYTVKLSVDPAAGTMNMKTWPDGGTEPSSWQASGKLADQGTLLDHTPTWFSCNCLPHDFDQNAVCPGWLAFLDEVFDGDQERGKSLQQWFGYNLVSDNRQHKLALLIGPPRSGKGTTMAVMSELLGKLSAARFRRPPDGTSRGPTIQSSHARKR